MIAKSAGSLMLFSMALSAALGAQWIEPAADTCAAATAETGVLPLPFSSTTVGQTDDYIQGYFDPEPTCAGVGTCVGGSGLYPGTGWGPDRAFKFVTDANCRLQVVLTPTRVPPNQNDDFGDDLALFVYRQSCSNDLAGCVCVSDDGIAYESETLAFDAVAGTAYYVVVDGFSIETPTTAGPFDLAVSVTSGSCTLCPESGCGPVAPPTPGGVAATDGTHLDKVRATWSAAATASRYEVYRNLVDETSGASTLTTTETSTAFDDLSAVAPTTYYYWVRACNGDSCSGFSFPDAGYRGSSAGVLIFADGFETGGCRWDESTPDLCPL